MYTLDAVQVARPLMVARSVGMRVTPLTRQLTKTTAATAATRPATPSAAPQTVTPQQVVVVVPKEEKKDTPEPWYKSTAFVGSVATTVVLAVVGLVVKKVSGVDTST